MSIVKKKTLIIKKVIVEIEFAKVAAVAIAFLTNIGNV